LNLEKLGRNDRILAVVGILAFIDMFLPWYSVSSKGISVGGFTEAGYSVSGNAWNGYVGFEAWFSLLLLLAIGVVAALPAFEQKVTLPGGHALLTILAALAVLLIVIRWLTYDSASSFGAGIDGISAGASFGTYLGLVLALVSTAFAYLSFTADGGSLSNIGAAFQKPAAPDGQVPGQAYPPPVDYGQPQAPYQPPQAPYQPPQDPQA
jgi:hypothetical protein